MKTFTLIIAVIAISFIPDVVKAGDGATTPGQNNLNLIDSAKFQTRNVGDSSKTRLKRTDHNLLLDMPDASTLNQHAILKFNNKRVITDSLVFKPTIKLGLIGQMYASGEQDGFSNPQKSTSANTYNKGFTISRVRIMVGAQVSRKGSFFLETELASGIGGPLADGTKNVKVSPIILDAQYEYDFATGFQLIAGQQFVSSTRNGLQSAATLMGIPITITH